MIDRAVKHGAKQRQAIGRFLRELKQSSPCADCHVSYPYYVMQFDHVRGIKEFDLGSFAQRSMKRVLAEVGKCDLVCGNCHAERTHQRRQRLSVRVKPLSSVEQDGLW
jgi:hypothetical protein